jgi:hypothetical protein
MALTAANVQNIANAALDFYINKGDSVKQSIQKRPMLDAFDSKSKTFPGGKGDLDLAVVGDYGAGGTDDTLKGYSYADTLLFYNPENIKRVKYPWREHHIGINTTYTELKIDGISVVDEFGKTSEHSQRDVTVLVELLQNKLDDLSEKYARDMDKLIHGDGTGDAKALAGLKALIKDAPGATGVTIGGLDTKANVWWRNRARTAAMKTAIAADASLSAWGGDAVASSATDGGALAKVLQFEFRQLQRFGGKPTNAFVGSAFLEALESELRANGVYTQSGFASGSTDMSVGKLNFMGIELVYDPTMDDNGMSKRGYFLDMKAIRLYKMENEWLRTHTPARPHDKFVFHRSLTSTGALVATQLNSSLVIDVA